MALKLQKFFKTLKREKLRKKFTQLYYLHKGYTVNWLKLEPVLVLVTLSYLNALERFKVGQLCKQVKGITQEAFLWRDLNIY
jgi:hypothetical protein